MVRTLASQASSTGSNPVSRIYNSLNEYIITASLKLFTIQIFANNYIIRRTNIIKYTKLLGL